MREYALRGCILYVLVESRYVGLISCIIDYVVLVLYVVEGCAPHWFCPKKRPMNQTLCSSSVFDMWRRNENDLLCFDVNGSMT